MRPVKLTMKAFGSFARETVVDFDKLGGGLYLIVGKTGAGKTTIFDAISFALFGEPSGSERDAKMFHSDFVPLSEDTVVKLSFVHNGRQYLVERNSIDLSKIKIPGYLVDYVVVDPDQPQSNDFHYKPSYCGASREPVTMKWPKAGIDERKFIARRQAMELRPGMLVNIGVGVSNGVPIILSEEGCWEQITLSLEQGQSGGVPVMGLDAGIMMNPRIILDHPVQHDLYHGGVLDATCLSAAETDFWGNVNVSKLGKSVTGCGGFIDISQETKKIVFGGTLCAKSKVKIADGKVTVLEQGTIRKFVNQVQQITFSGRRAIEKGKRVVFITERCVFELRKNGLTLVEIAPGIDMERDIFAQMDYRPLISDDLKEMPAVLFYDGVMGLKEIWAQNG